MYLKEYLQENKPSPSNCHHAYTHRDKTQDCSHPANIPGDKKPTNGQTESVRLMENAWIRAMHRRQKKGSLKLLFQTT